MAHPDFDFTAAPTAELLVHTRGGIQYQVTQVAKNHHNPTGHQSIVLGGTIVAQAKAKELGGGDMWLFRLQYHGGRQTWMLESERYSPRHIYPRDDEFAPLPYLMDRFEQRTGLSLPALRIATLGLGITSYTSKGETRDLLNPWQLQVGHYRVLRQNVLRKIEALEVNGDMRVRFIDGDAPSETFEPNLVLDASAWLSLTRLGAENAANAAKAAPRTMRP